MGRRNFLRDILLWILAFFFGYTVNEEGGKLFNQQDGDEHGKKLSDKVKTLIDTSSDHGKKIDNISKKAEGIIHVKEFGAKGDGETDDTTAINNAIEYCFKNKKTLNFGSGSYLYDKKTTWYINGEFNGHFIDWIGMGARIIFKRLDIAYIAFYKMEYVHLVGIDFEGPAAVGGSPNQNAVGIAVYSTKRLIVNRCSFINFIGDGLLISSEQIDNRKQSSQNIKVQNCYFSNNGRGGLTVVGCVSGVIENNHFGAERLMLAPVVGEVLHIESDPKTRYGVEGLAICYNLIYNAVNLTNSTWTEGYIGEKDTWINFHHNKVIVDDNLYGIISAGGNIKIIDNEIDVTRNTTADDLGIGALFLKCNSAIIERNTIKTKGKGTLISVYNWTHGTKGKVIFRENNYTASHCSYIYRFFKDIGGSFSENHKIVKIQNEDFIGVTNANWLLSAPQSGGNAQKYFLEGIIWTHQNGMEFKNTTKNHILYLRDCIIVGEDSLISWNNVGTAIKVYYENCNLSGTVATNIPTYPIDLAVVYKISGKINDMDINYPTSIIGRKNTLTKISKGKYKWDAFSLEDLYNYSFSAQILLNSKETGFYNLSFQKPTNDKGLLTIEIKNESNLLVDLPDNSGIQIIGKNLSKNAISVVAS
ncbi:glycosyl hydrolase family 28-related protein [Peribacillus simplex]|uniref:glycosyl hydrolase family 28-related protein n=1 Tax=Peribacillus simplex TaxID=1478 RepID=UPI0024C1FB47|nr:glycosyl hydrolase family 28-related protein [Peribacillus simplex]WHY55217.1 glycosyl hydrolase family 28-related protein [Peribacillus simplex]